MTVTERRLVGREVYLDNLKVVLITLIIVIHAVLGYAGLVEVWTYAHLRETTLSPAVELVAFILVAPFAFTLMALFFLVAGLFSAPSVERKGVAAYVRDRVLRLGVTYVVYVLVVQPTVTYLLEHPLGDAPGSYWEEYLAQDGSHRLDSGPLWFVGTLLVFSLGYAAWTLARRRWGDGRRPTWSRRRVTTGGLALLTGVVAVVSFVVRVGMPYGSEAGRLDLNYWEWPGCLAAFGIGIVASRLGWVHRVPDDLRRNARTVTLVAVGLMFALLVVAGARDVVDEELLGGVHLLALGFSLVEAALVVFGPVWLLAVCQRLLHVRLPWGTAAARSAFGAFILQAPVLIGLALALRPLDAPAELKAPVVAAGGVALSYAAAHLLVTRVPGVGRVL
ncbi:MAG TPA: acyltransferase [Marmoricola sp.]|nr:acyltransferase [Marmoricola sp.]